MSLASLRRWLREPLLHFLLVGALLFGAEQWFASRTPARIVIDRATVEQLIRQREQLELRKLTPEERRRVIAAYVDDEILYHEAYRRGLDRVDSRLRRNLILKMRGLLTDEIPDPPEQTLRRYYRENPGRFVQPVTLDLEHILFLNEDDVPPDLPEALARGASPDRFGTILPGLGRRLPGLTRSSLARVFGAEAAGRIMTLEDDRWHGPIRSRRGIHFVRVMARHPAQQPSYDEIRAYVRDVWLLEQSRARVQQELQRLRGQYTIIVAEAGEGAS